MSLNGGYRFGLGIGACLTGFGLCKLLAQLFLGSWQVLSAGQHDIAARGIWLLAAFLPEIAIGSVILTVILVATLTRNTNQPFAERLVLSTLGSAVGVALIFFGADPTARLLSLLSWPSSFAYYAVSAVLAVVIFGAGVAMVVRMARVLRPLPAAA
jgi:hypothetical protein